MLSENIANQTRSASIEFVIRLAESSWLAKLSASIWFHYHVEIKSEAEGSMLSQVLRW